MIVRHIILVGICLLWLSPALAQTGAPDPKAAFASYVNSPAYKEYLERIFNLGEPASLRAECPTLKVVESNRTIVLEQPTFVRAGANYNIDTGSWVGLAVLDRCGSRVTRRALIKAIPGKNSLHPTFLLPGDFRGNLKLEADAKLIVIPGLMAQTKCKDLQKFSVLNIKGLTSAGPSGWSETWTAEACGTKVEADVTYTSTGTGMNVAAGNWRVR